MIEEEVESVMLAVALIEEVDAPSVESDDREPVNVEDSELVAI